MEAQSRRPKPIPVSEALKLLPINRETFYRKLKAGEYPYFRFGRRILVDIDEVLLAMRVK